MSTCIEAVELLQKELHASSIELFVKNCADYARACEELGGETCTRLPFPNLNEVLVQAGGWSGTILTHPCHAVPDCGGKR